MKDLLKLIEDVDSSDTAMMDEIDFQVYQYLSEIRHGIRNYTRSRDALKAIRPEGYHFRIRAGGTTNNCTAVKLGSSEPRSFSRESYQTEELAELHAIIQAIEYERNKSKGVEG